MKISLDCISRQCVLSEGLAKEPAEMNFGVHKIQHRSSGHIDTAEYMISECNPMGLVPGPGNG